MNQSLLLLAVLVLPVAAGCRTWHGHYHVSAEDQVLGKRTDDDGQTTTWTLRSGTAPSLVAVTERQEERAALGLTLVELDKQQAEPRGVRPYTGLLVRKVATGSAAAAAGVLAGDVLLAIDGREMVYEPQAKAAEQALRPGQVVTLRVLRGQDTLDLDLEVGARRETVRREEPIELERPAPLPRPYAGLALLGIPAAQCERIFGSPRQAVVVGQVEVGSPGWIAGIRPGDVIDTVDGQPVPDVHTLQRQIAERGPARERIVLGVRRGRDGAHEADVALADYQSDTRIRVPLVFCLEDGVWVDRWSVGPFGLLLRNRNSYIADASTRRVKTHNVFSAVLGLFRVETTPDETHVRLLWFIRFET
jgi:S1-C subfamily serine protease